MSRSCRVYMSSASTCGGGFGFHVAIGRLPEAVSLLGIKWCCLVACSVMSIGSGGEGLFSRSFLLVLFRSGSATVVERGRQQENHCGKAAPLSRRLLSCPQCLEETHDGRCACPIIRAQRTNRRCWIHQQARSRYLCYHLQGNSQPRATSPPVARYQTPIPLLQHSPLSPTWSGLPCPSFSYSHCRACPHFPHSIL